VDIMSLQRDRTEPSGATGRAGLSPGCGTETHVKRGLGSWKKMRDSLFTETA
jgi:hypothetical protein